MKRLGRLLFAAVALAGSVASAFGQGALVQGGSVTPGHLPMYVQGGSGAQTIVQDSGPAGGGVQGLGVSEFLMTSRGTGTAPFVAQGTGPLGTTRCSYDGPTNSANGYHYSCDSPNAQGGGLFVYGAGGIASALPYCFNINGVTSCLGGSSGTGFVTATIPTTTGAVTCWANTSGGLGNCSAGAATLFGNPSASPAIPAPFTIQGLVARGAPDATNDKIPLYDAASGTIKYVTPGQVAASATSGVSSLGGVTGAITVGAGLTMVGQDLRTNYLPSWVGAVAITQTTIDDGTVYGASFLGSKTCDGTTDVSVELQAFLTAVAANGPNHKTVTGVFPPGVCALNSATSLTLTINSSTQTQNYQLIGYGTTLLPDPSRAVSGLIIARGAISTYEDERTKIFVRGLVIDNHNNANALSGFSVQRASTILDNVAVNAGDDNGTHNNSTYACASFEVPAAHAGDADYGTFWSQVTNSTFKGRANRAPVGIRLQGTTNSMIVSGNKLIGVDDGIQTQPLCAANTDLCASIGNGVVINGLNDFEDFTNAIHFVNTTSTARSQAVGWQITGNRAEAATAVVGTFVNLDGLGKQTTLPMVLGPNAIQGNVANYFTQGATPVALNILDFFPGNATIDFGNLVAGDTATNSSIVAVGATTAMVASVQAVGDTQGVQLSAWVSSTNVITVRATNATSGAVNLPSLLFQARATYVY